MNICIIVPEQNAYSETFVQAHIHRLPGKVTYAYGGFFPTHAANGKPLLNPPKFLERIKRFFLGKFLKFDYSDKTLLKAALSNYLLENKIDVVLAEYGPTAVEVMDICKNAQVSLVAHFHGFDASRLSILQEYKEGYRKLFNIADALVVVSKTMQTKMIELGAPKEKIYCNSCGANTELFYDSNPSQSEPIFLTTGRFVDKKGPHLTILAFQRTITKVPEAKLIMVGDGALLDACISLVKALGIENSVSFPGIQTPQQVAQLMRQSRAFLQHSITPASGDSEGTPVAIQEAGAAGLPVIATYHAGIPDVIQDGMTGFLIKEYDIEAMSDKMTQLALDSKLATRMGKAAQERILSQFTLDQSISRLAKILETAIKQKNRTNI